MNSKHFGCNHKDHSHCVGEALDTAQKICVNRGVRLTDMRLQVLELIWRNHKPLGAYTLLEMLTQISQRRVAPPTVYRALEFLLEQGFIHRINSLNAFVGCTSYPHEHQSYFLICHQCGNVMELQLPQLDEQIHTVSKKVGFVISSQSLEIVGVCALCKPIISGPIIPQ